MVSRAREKEEAKALGNDFVVEIKREQKGKENCLGRIGKKGKEGLV